MARIFFPGCKVKARYPEASRKLSEAVERFGFADKITGCCRVNHQSLNADDTAVTICCNCMAMIDEDGANEDMLSVWELIDQTPDFPLPDYGGMTVAIQDCGRAYDRREMQDAIRSILMKMNVNVIECDDSREKSTYCGSSFLMAAPKQEAAFAPKRYVEDAKKRSIYVETDPDEIPSILKAHAEKIPVEDVVVYCTACDAGLETSGKHPVNLIELVFGAFRERDWDIPFREVA